MAKIRKYRRRSPFLGVLIAVCMALAVLALVAALLWTPMGGEDASSAPVTTTTTTVPTQKYTAMVVTADTLNVRTGPGTDYDVQGQLLEGDEVQVLATEGEWCRIQYKGAEAYVSAAYLVAFSNGTTATTTTTSTTSATTTTKKPGTTTSVTYTDRYIDEDGMLQFKTDGRYVQSASYTSATEVPWELLLVNDWNPMPAGYDDKVTMATISGKAGAKQVDSRMLSDLQAMLTAGKAYDIGVQSAYRSASKQKELYWRQVAKWKSSYKDEISLQTKAGTIVKRPGYSEHNTGLAVDLYGSGDYSLTETFANTAAYKWLIENCADYGFVLRFPKGKESITGVIYEAWHFRYVGSADVAHAIMDNGLCLEEYLEQNKK